MIKQNARSTALWGTAALLLTLPGAVEAAGYHHVHLSVPNASEAVKWYARHLGCQPIEERSDASDCGSAEIVFESQMTVGGSPGTGVDHISFSFADLTAKMAELEAVGVRGSGVRLQRFADGATVHELPGLFKYGFIFDPWGTRIELVEDAETLGFHHLHLRSTDPDATLAWYRDVLGGEEASLKGRADGLRFGSVWLLVSPQPEGEPAATEGRSIDHLSFVVTDLDAAAKKMKKAGADFVAKPRAPENGRSSAKRGFLVGPDQVRVAVVESGWAGVTASSTTMADATEIADSAPYTVPRTPWGEPDLQGIWTGNAAHGIPLERPKDTEEKEALTPEEAAARRERGTLGSIWGYEREWRDTTLGYVKSAPSTQVAMVIDPPDGRLPPRTESGKKQDAEERAGRGYGLPEGPEDLPNFVRCITRGLPGTMMPGIYNNGLQIVQSPGFVAIQKEMIHETRIIPTDGRAHLGADLSQWLGDSRGRWEGDTLVVEVTNFNGRAPYRGSGRNLKLVERFTRTSEGKIEYRFTVDDPTIWTKPWTGRFEFELDEGQYELVEYACHEGNYGMTNILSGARAKEKAGDAATKY